MYRYLILLVEGGIYSDMDTTVLKPPKIWGNNADHFGDGPFDGDVSVCIGIEADVGNREDWHDVCEFLRRSKSLD
jgi:alpha 1,6-mannosyltransferase